MTTLWPDVADLPVATDHQRERIARGTRLKVGIVGGNPGAGKTHCLAQVVKLCAERYGRHSVCVAAPTGKAAVRIESAMRGHDLDVPAATVHRTLGVQRNGHDGKGWGFLHNAMNPLPQRFVFVDEASMLGTNLASSLLAACAPGTHVLFVGDFAQLPPVDHGAPLRDMIEAGVPYGELEEVHRNGGDIYRVCADLKAGLGYRPSRHCNLTEKANAPHIECSRPTQQLSALARMLKSPPADIDPVWDVQVLCAVNDNTPVCRAVLNAGMQKILNPDGRYAEEGGFRLGDKVICKSNTLLPVVKCQAGTGCVARADEILWDKAEGRYVCRACGAEWKPSEMTGDLVANGELGKVVLVEEGLIHVAIDTPERTVRVSGEFLNAWDLGYAITTHKSQGSQWKVVIEMVDDSHAADRVTSYEWWRTAISRPEQLNVTIGSLAAINRQCKVSSLRGRKTFLVEGIAPVFSKAA